MVSEKLISRHALANGLTLELWDLSGPVAGDRWQVVMEARMPIPITAANLPPELRPRIDEVIIALGREIAFSQQKVRNFIAAAEVAGLLKEMATRFLASVATYLGSPDFAPKYIHKTFAAHQEKQRWHKR
jgi:hypothetical protein